MYKHRVTNNIMTKFINCMDNNKKLFLSYHIVMLNWSEILTDVVDSIGFCSSFYPSTTPIVVSKASIEMWKGRD
jgi:hypothetical protein